MKQCPYCGAEYPDDAAICATDETPLEKPQSQKEPATSSIERLWTPYLILCSISAGLSVLVCLVQWQRMNDELPVWQLTFRRSNIFLTAWAIVAIWRRSRLGVVAYIALGIIAAGVELVTRGIDSAIQCISVIIVFIILVRPQWRHMTWDSQMRGKKNADAQPPQEPTPK